MLQEKLFKKLLKIVFTISSTAHRELLLGCGFALPTSRTLEELHAKRARILSFFLYHPALGPLYSTIREKLNRGALASGAELLLEISDFNATDLHVNGSLQVMRFRGGAF